MLKYFHQILRNINVIVCAVCKVCESRRTTDDLDLQSLATHVTETLVFHIQQRVAEKPAGIYQAASFSGASTD